MQTYIARRLLIAIPMLIGITMMTYAFINLAPGDPVSAMADPQLTLGRANPKQLERLGLHKPVAVRYVIWLRELATGNFGYSYQSGQPVLKIIRARVLPTLELTSVALVLSVVSGTVFGVIAALRQYSIYDYVLSVAALVGLSIPTFFFALLALYVFAALLPVFPSFGMTTYGTDYSALDNFHHLILPATVLAIDSMASNTRYARTAMLEVMKSDYVTTARAKGLSEFSVIGRHAFKNALLPLITITTLRLPFLFGGAFLIEYMFAWPGMGQLGIQATFMRDYTVLMGLAVIIAVLVLGANLLADVLYAYADPRVRLT